MASCSLHARPGPPGAPLRYAALHSAVRAAESKFAFGQKTVFGGLALFSLAGSVAFAGSRYGSPWAVAPVVASVLAAGGSVRVGCARGVDLSVRVCAGASAVVVSASAWSHLPPRAALSVRTRAVVSGASALLVFPPASGVLGPGSALALSVALELGLPVWVAGSLSPAGLSWVASPVAGVPGFVCVPAQPSLF